jgi:hyaluronan synthase
MSSVCYKTTTPKICASLFGNQADYLYPAIVLVNILAALSLSWVWLSLESDTAFLRPFDITRTDAVLGLGLTAFGTLVLIWRIWMAYRYRPYASVIDDELPRLTVVIPAYNEGRQILDTVHSVVNSDYPCRKMNVVCVDDGSSDDTWWWMQKARRAYPQRLRLIRLPKNCGKRHALMAGLRYAQGSVYVTIDSDSEVLPNTLRNLVSPMAADPRVGAVAGNVRVLNRHEGALPKMMEVFFTASFDFVRAGQSVFGGVVCTPGALSAYRASAVKPHLKSWLEQTFMGVPATIGEDRALTNIVLKNGYRVVYQRGAVVLTKVPTAYKGLRRMLLRWARSNVRESLVMSTFMFRRFRPGDGGSGWVRVSGAVQLIRLAVGEALKIGVLAQLLIQPLPTFGALIIGCMAASVVPAMAFVVYRRSWSGWRWALPYSLFWLVGLSWISCYGLISAAQSGWLTRNLTPKKVVQPSASLEPPRLAPV